MLRDIQTLMSEPLNLEDLVIEVYRRAWWGYEEFRDDIEGEFGDLIGGNEKDMAPVLAEEYFWTSRKHGGDLRSSIKGFLLEEETVEAREIHQGVERELDLNSEQLIRSCYWGAEEAAIDWMKGIEKDRRDLYHIDLSGAPTDFRYRDQ